MVDIDVDDKYYVWADGGCGVYIYVTQGWDYALKRASNQGHREIVRALLAAGADINLQSNVSADGDVRNGWPVAYMLTLIYAQLTIYLSPVGMNLYVYRISLLSVYVSHIYLVTEIHVYMYL